MNPGDVAVLLAAAGGLSGIAALIRVVHDRRQGIASAEQAARAEEREDRRDVREDLTAVIDRLLEQVQGYREEVLDLRKQQAEDRRRIESLEQDRRIDRAHIRTLEDWIWDQKPPPPPPRPGG